MIVFNIPAVVVAAIIGLLYWLLSLVISDSWMATGNNQNLLIFGIGSVVSIITEFVGLKGRLFWLPMWVFGLGGLGWFSYQEWGWMGPVVIVLIGVAVFFGSMFLSKKLEQKAWEKAPLKLQEAQKEQGETLKLWQLLEEAMFIPVSLKYTPEICTHNLKVIGMMSQYLKEESAVGRIVSDFQRYMEAGAQPMGEDELKVPDELEEKLEKLFTARIEWFEKQENAGN